MKRQGRRRGFYLGLLILVALLSLFGVGQARAQAPGNVLVATFHGEVNPILASYVERTISRAETSGAAAVVIELDTPGGSTASMMEITQRMGRATVPVIVYVSPRGAHASSAGTFITLAAHVAAMAPGSTIGAASPVEGSGQDLPATMKAKVTNTLVSDIKNLAARRGNKATAWAEKAVSEAATATADEALQMGVIDAVANDLPSLLRQIDGRQVNMAGQTVTLQLSDRPVVPVNPSPLEDFLNTLTTAIMNPSVAAILLTLGSTGLILELTHPGTYLPGTAGAICLVLALYALGILEANWAGLAFVGLAFVLFVVDLKAPTHGLLSFAGIGSFLLGGFLLFNTPGQQVPWVTLIVLALSTGAFFAFAITKAVRAQHQRPVTGMENLVGQTVEVRKVLDPTGMVFVEGELWSAQVDDGPVPVGDRVTVIGYDGFELQVRRNL